MNIVERIVDALLEGEADLAELIKRTLMYDVADVDYEFKFGVGVNANIQEEDLREDGIDPQTLDWSLISDDLDKIERNVMALLKEKEIICRPEGHDSDGVRIASAWMRLHPPEGLKGIKFLEGAVEIDEPYRTSSGTMPLFIEQNMYKGVTNPTVLRYTDVDLIFFATDNLKRFFELVNDHRMMPTDAINTMADIGLTEAFLGSPEPSGVFKSTLGDRTTFSAKCPSCRRIHGNFRTFKEAAGNKMCRYCIRGFVDKIGKVRETGNFKSLLKKDNHAKTRH